MSADHCSMGNCEAVGMTNTAKTRDLTEYSWKERALKAGVAKVGKKQGYLESMAAHCQTLWRVQW